MNAVYGSRTRQEIDMHAEIEERRDAVAELCRRYREGWRDRNPEGIPGHAEPPFPIPANWRWSQIAEIGMLSPRNEAPDTQEASLVPMPMTSVEYGVANQHEVKKGYTHFAEGDVGLAKITPCFEKGKSTVFRNDWRDWCGHYRTAHRAPAVRRSGLHPAFSREKRVPTEYFAQVEKIPILKPYRNVDFLTFRATGPAA